MRNCEPPPRRAQFQILALMPAYFIAAGLLLQPFDDIWKGIAAIIREPDFLITDYFVIGGVGSAFVNAGILTLLSIAIVYFLGMEMSGHTITSCFLMFGFSLFGKNILNIWSIMLGVCLYAYYHKTALSRYIYVGFYGTCLSPIVTQIMHMVHLPLGVRLILSLLTGVCIGFVLPPLSTHTHYAHKGYSLYNVGFAGGIIAIIVVSLMKSFGITIEARLIWYTGRNVTFAVLLLVLFSSMVIFPLLFGKNAGKQYLNLLKTTGISGTDYVKSEGMGATLVNMGVNGMVSALIVLAVGGDLNGPVIGSILTVVGFSATGKHIRNILPIMLGVLLGSWLKVWTITEPSAILALLLSTTLAPIAGEYGVIAGIAAGFLHSSAALNVGIVYGGMNLYNNGFAGGLIATFMVPVLQSLKDRKARARVHDSL